MRPPRDYHSEPRTVTRNQLHIVSYELNKVLRKPTSCLHLPKVRHDRRNGRFGGAVMELQNSKRHTLGSTLLPYNSVPIQQTISTQSHLILREGRGSPFTQLGRLSESVTFTSDEHLYETKSPFLIWECDRFAARYWHGQARERRFLMEELSAE